MDKKTFFAYARRAPFGGRLTQEQVDNLNVIIDTFLARSKDPRFLAYVLATAFHETGAKMTALREGFAKTEAGARKAVASRKYGKPDPETKHVYYGRGYVQLTWRDNYDRFGKRLGLDLVRKPDLALDPKTAAVILVDGMLLGLFTGEKLSDYFNEIDDDAVNARRIVNGIDKASLIAGHHKAFLGAVEAAMKDVTPEDVNDDDATPDVPALTTDKTVWGSITSVVGAGGAGALTSIDNPWALAAVVVVGIGALLFLTGRLEIRRKAGA